MTRGDFTPQAPTYAASRPTYPEALLDELIAHVQVRPGEAVADIGAGTGLFTQALARRGFAVTAIEPNAAMREHAPPMPGVRWVDGTFETTTLDDRSQRWVTAAQAFHWADAARTLPELRRVLAPAGHVTVLWNHRLNDETPLLAAAWRIITQARTDFDDNYRSMDWPGVLASTGDFGQVACHEARHVITMDRARFINLWKSHNRLNVTLGAQRMREVLRAIEDLVKDAHTIDVPYLCKAWTARAVDPPPRASSRS